MDRQDRFHFGEDIDYSDCCLCSRLLGMDNPALNRSVEGLTYDV